MNTVIFINGRGASGKNTLIKELNSYFGFDKFRTCTTRPPRFAGEDDYQFLTETEFFDRIKNNQILEMYFRQSNQSFYGTPAPTGDCIVQAEIMAQVALKKWCFQHGWSFLSIFLRVDENVLLERLLARKDPNEDPQTRLKEDRYYEEFLTLSDIVYDYSDKSVAQ